MQSRGRPIGPRLCRRRSQSSQNNDLGPAFHGKAPKEASTRCQWMEDADSRPASTLFAPKQSPWRPTRSSTRSVQIYSTTSTSSPGGRRKMSTRFRCNSVLSRSSKLPGPDRWISMDIDGVCPSHLKVLPLTKEGKNTESCWVFARLERLRSFIKRGRKMFDYWPKKSHLLRVFHVFHACSGQMF